jgi:alkyl sulfatase BDS1-like metallo-beta-lactamase superfamily hydrolase
MPGPDPIVQGKVPSDFVTNTNAAIAKTIPPRSADAEWANAGKGLVAAFPPDFSVPVPGRTYPAWDLTAYSATLRPFENPQKAAPASVNPSLWRNAQLNMNAGLYKVTDHVYQVRGADLSDISFLEDPTGTTTNIVVVDPLVSEECAAAALNAYLKARGPRKIIAVIYTHSHVDHYGGVGGLFGPDGPGDEVQFIAPAGFLDHAVSENVYAGVAMGHRAVYMYGVEIPRDQYGSVDAGLGKNTSTGTIGIIAPTLEIEADTPMHDPMLLGNLKVVFKLTPDTEAPSEMLFYLPQTRALCMAENATPTLHNVYSLRGAQVRDAKAWSQYLNDAIDTFGPITDVLFASHFWPRWNEPNNPQSTVITDFLASQADLYRFLHDQTLRLANEGSTLLEVAEQLDDVIPSSLADQWFNHGYYGTANHNLKAVYQRYLGWFDGNPAHLHTLTPQQVAPRYVLAMGGPADVINIVHSVLKNPQSIDDYRWAAELLNHVVFGYPDNLEARNLQADILEQLAYLAESGPWRNFYLAGAWELRGNDVVKPQPAAVITPDMIAAMDVGQVFDYLGIRLNPVDKAVQQLTYSLNVTTENSDSAYWVEIRNCVVVLHAESPDQQPDASYVITRDGLNKLALNTATTAQLIDKELWVTSGNINTLNTFLSYLDVFMNKFPIAMP